MTANDQIYIDNIKDQIDKGMYDHLFVGRKDLVFLDIGANVGLVSIFATLYCKRIVAIEPAPETYAMLQENTKNHPVIECLELALAPIVAPQEFYVNDINFTASSTVNTYGKKIAVDGITLSGLLVTQHLDHVDVCKIDCEGAEGDSLNMEELYWSRSRIKTYMIEFHNCPRTSWEHKLGTIVGNLARCGYTKMTVDGMAVTATRP